MRLTLLVGPTLLGRSAAPVLPPSAASRQGEVGYKPSETTAGGDAPARQPADSVVFRTGWELQGGKRLDIV